MWQKDHRKSKKACVPRSAFEEEPLNQLNNQAN